MRYKSVICDKCGVEVTQARVRRERMGHITLATPTAHVWFFKGAPSKISLILGVAPRGLEQVIYFARYLVIDVNEDLRADAIKNIGKARDVRLSDVLESFKTRRDSLGAEAKEAGVKISEKIKNKEQASLPVS